MAGEPLLSSPESVGRLCLSFSLSRPEGLACLGLLLEGFSGTLLLGVARSFFDLSLRLSLGVFCSNMTLFYLFPSESYGHNYFLHLVGCVWVLYWVLWASFGVVLGFLTFVFASWHSLAWQGRGRATQGI